MEKIFFTTSVILLCFTANAQSRQNVDTVFIRELMQLAHKRIEAFDLGDTSIWSPFVTNEYIIATPTGKVITKADVMHGFGPPMQGYKDVFHFEDVHVIKDTNVAVMSYKIKEHEWWANQDNDVPDLRKTDTYILKNERWLLLASHETFYPVVRKAIPINPKIYDRYIGRYQVMPGLVYTISKENNKLLIWENANSTKAELFPLSNNVFFSQPDTGFFNEGGVGVVVFVADNKGNITSVAFRRYSAEIKTPKIE
jgi:hypothetical protein